MSGNKSITDFFKNSTSQPSRSSPRGVPNTSHRTLDAQISSTRETDRAPPTVHNGTDQGSNSSSDRATPHLQPSAEDEHVAVNPDLEAAAVVDPPNDESRVVKDSDDEDEDSDTSLPELFPVQVVRKPALSSNETTRPKTPPKATGYPNKGIDFHISPLALLSKKPKFDLNTLIKHARQEQAAEESSRKARELLKAKKDSGRDAGPAVGDAKKVKLARHALLESVIDEGDEEGMTKVTRALMRTEATVVENRFYFFDTQSNTSNPSSTPWPKGRAMKSWQKELKDPVTRQQSFESGFVADLISLGKTLPDELFSWILSEACLESRELLRVSYFDCLRACLRACPEQVNRLIVPEMIQSLFQRLGATEAASTLTTKVIPTRSIPNAYSNRNWQRLCSFVRFLGGEGVLLSQNSQEYTLCILLRISMDRVVVENVGISTEVQRALECLTHNIPRNEWEKIVRYRLNRDACDADRTQCELICKTSFDTVPLPSLRFRMVNVIPSITDRLHDLRRRLGMCFFFNDLSYSKVSPYESIDLVRVLDRLDDRDFDTRPQTDFVELAALILLLDVAVDDGRANRLDLRDAQVEKKFNQDVDNLVACIRDIMTSIGNPGAAFISRIEAKEVLELVSQRIADTVRTKKVYKERWFDRAEPKGEDRLSAERKGMSDFLVKLKSKETK